MRGLVAGPAGVEPVARPAPRPAPDGVVVAVHSCGICGSDVHMVARGMVPHGQVLGHEFSGTVVEVGRDATGWRQGQAVAVNPLGSCGSCDACRRQLPFLCQAVPNLGIDAPGAFAEYVAVPRGQLLALPGGADPELGAHAEPLAVALHALALARVAPGDASVVYGVGPIGLNVIMALRAADAGRIVAGGRGAWSGSWSARDLQGGADRQLEVEPGELGGRVRVLGGDVAGVHGDVAEVALHPLAPLGLARAAAAEQQLHRVARQPAGLLQ